MKENVNASAIKYSWAIDLIYIRERLSVKDLEIVIITI